MSHAFERLVDRFVQRSVAAAPSEVISSLRSVVIRPARDEDLPMLHDLAELDSSAPLAGPALVAVVDGRPWAAYGLDDDRVIADPFHPSAAAAGLLCLRVRQLRAARIEQRARRRKLARRVGAS